jgi:hypothetical protein
MPKNTPQRIIDQKPGTSGALFLSGGAGGSAGVTDHGLLTGLADDDHAQYHNDARGDLRYVPLARTVGAGSGLTGGGALSANITLAVGAGAGITVNADDVALTTPGSLTVSSTNSATGSHTHAVSSSSAPGAAASLLATDGSGYLSLVRLTLADRLRTGLIDTVTGNLSVQPAGDLYINTGTGIVRLAVGDLMQSNSFASGFTGSGWRIDDGLTEAGKHSGEFDNLTVRGRMRVYEMLIQQIRASNGSLFVTSGSRVVSVTTAANPNWTVNGSQLTFNGQAATFSTTLYTIGTAAAGDTGRELYHGFLYGDLIAAQQTRWDGAQFAGVILSKLEVTAVANLYTYQAALVSGDAPVAGYDYVRRGNTVDSTRRGAIYLTSDDSNAPFIDIVDGLASHDDWGSAGVRRVRLGKLSGISDPAFGGTLPGYGLYANNVYLKGQIVVTGGNLGGLAAADINSNTTTIDGGKITANTVTAAKISTTTLSAITADLGTVTAGSIVVGGTNKLWLNDSDDGKLAIGGSVKASAPFQVAANGTLNTTAALIGNVVNVDNVGIYINPPTNYETNYGYKFKSPGGAYGGLWSYGSTANLVVAGNKSAAGVTIGNANNTVDVSANANGASVQALVNITAYNSARATPTAQLQVAHNTSGQRVLTWYGDLTYVDTGSGTHKWWHAGNDGSGSGLDADTLDTYDSAAFARLAGGGMFTAAIGVQQQYIKFTPYAQGSPPGYSNLSNGEFMVYAINVGTNSYKLQVRGKNGAGSTYEGDLFTVPGT